MKKLFLSVLFICSSVSALEYKVGDKAIYKYDIIFEGDTDYIYEIQKVSEVSDNGKSARIEMEERMGLDGPIVYSDSWWDGPLNAPDGLENFECKSKFTSLTVHAGTFNVCMDWVGENGNGYYMSKETSWGYIRTQIEACIVFGDEESCQTYRKDLHEIIPAP